MVAIFLKFIDFQILPYVLIVLSIILYHYSIKIQANDIRETPSKAQLKSDFRLFLQYLDRYAITNIYVTIAHVFLYFMLLSGIILIWRLSFIGCEQYINQLDSVVGLSINDYVVFIFFVVNVIIFTISFRHFINVLFYRDINKLHIYLQMQPWYDNIEAKITLRNFTDFLYQFVQGILSYILERNLDQDAIDCYKSFGILQDKNIWEKATKWSNRCQKYKVLYLIFQLLYNYLENIEHQIKRICMILHALTIIIGWIELFNHKLYFFYYAIVLLFLTQFWMQCKQFFDERDTLDDYRLSQYFYSTHLNKQLYTHRRKKLFNNENTFYKDIDTESLYHSFILSDKLVLYILKDNFKKEISSNMVKIQKIEKNRLYKEQCIIILAFIVLFYSFNGMYLMLALLSIMIYSFNKIETYQLGEKSTFQLNRKHQILFWVSFFIELYSIWIFIIKPELFFI